jgi:hypothetical protein
MTWVGLSHIQMLFWTVVGWGLFAFANIVLKRWPFIAKAAFQIFMAWVLLIVVPSVLLDGHPIDVCADLYDERVLPRECSSAPFRRRLRLEIQASGFLRFGVWVLTLSAFALALNVRRQRQ